MGSIIHIPLKFKEEMYKKLFYNKNNKTVKEIVNTKKYLSLKSEVYKSHPNKLDMKIGDFLQYLDEKNSTFYKNFLNKHGDKTYSTFYLENPVHHLLKGVYCFYLDGQLKYIGRCRDTMKKRINNGYGKITPTNCFKHGQSTNCKVNALITQYSARMTLKLIPMKNKKKIESLERRLIKAFNPAWNSRL